MLKFKTRVGARGQIVIPKVIRENLGLSENKTVWLEVKEKVMRLTVVEKDVVRSWEETAKREGGDVSKDFVYGDRLYEEVFE